LGYRIAYTARDMTHKTIDVVFFVTVFAFFARAASHLAALFFGTILGPQELPVSRVSDYPTMIGAIKRAPQYEDVVFALIGIFSAVIAAAVWRSWLENKVRDCFAALNISKADRTETA
jgi:hypothetical protein